VVCDLLLRADRERNRSSGIELPLNGRDEDCDGRDFAALRTLPPLPDSVPTAPGCGTADLALYAFVARQECTADSGFWVVVANRGAQTVPAGYLVSVSRLTWTVDSPLASGALSAPIKVDASPRDGSLSVGVPEGLVDCDLDNNSGVVDILFVECGYVDSF
jgi:hypothetical protein